MYPGMATDEVTDQIALIEMNRQETQKESGLSVACNQALSKLQELLNQEKEALQANPENGHAANVEAVMQQIARVKQLAGGGEKQHNGKRAHGQQHQPQQHQQHQQHRPDQPGGKRRNGA